MLVRSLPCSYHAPQCILFGTAHNGVYLVRPGSRLNKSTNLRKRGTTFSSPVRTCDILLHTCIGEEEVCCGTFVDIPTSMIILGGSAGGFHVLSGRQTSWHGNVLFCIADVGRAPNFSQFMLQSNDSSRNQHGEDFSTPPGLYRPWDFMTRRVTYNGEDYEITRHVFDGISYNSISSSPLHQSEWNSFQKEIRRLSQKVRKRIKE